MAFAKSPTFSFTFLKCIASCWPIFIFGLHFPGTLIFVPCAKCFVFYTLRSRGAWGRPNVPKMPLVTFRFRRLDPIASAFGPKGWTFRRSEPPRGSYLAPQGPIRRLIDGWLHGDFVRYKTLVWILSPFSPTRKGEIKGSLSQSWVKNRYLGGRRVTPPAGGF